MRAFSTGWTDLNRGAMVVAALSDAGLRNEPVVVMQTAANRFGHQLAVGGLLASQLGRRSNPAVSAEEEVHEL